MKIAEMRIEKKIFQKEMMKDGGLYSKMENGKCLPTEEDARRFAKILDCGVSDLFERDELSYFKSVLDEDSQKGSRLPFETEKSEGRLVCKPDREVKRHIGLTRKCYWLNKTRSARLREVILSQGFRTEQEWFSFMVDREIEEAARPDKADQSGN